MEAEDLAATTNIGTGAGTSVLEVMLAVKRVTGIDFECEPSAGLDRVIELGSSRIQQKYMPDLGWQSRHDLDSIIQSAWQAWPGG